MRNEPVYPIFNSEGFVSNNNGGALSGEGMGLTKREYFAAMMLQGIIMQRGYSAPGIIRNDAREAIQLADVLIEELNK